MAMSGSNMIVRKEKYMSRKLLEMKIKHAIIFILYIISPAVKDYSFVTLIRELQLEYLV